MTEGHSRRYRILRLVLNLGETNAPYNQFSLPAAGGQEITLCSFLPSPVPVPDGLFLAAGDGTVRGFMVLLVRLLRARRYDVLHAHSVHVACLFLLVRPFIRTPPPTLFTFHSSYPNYSTRNRLLLFLVLLFFARTVCCSHASYASLPWLAKRLGRRGLRVVQNGMDITRLDRVTEVCRHAGAPAGRPFTVTFVGRIIPVKDPVCALEAYAMSSLADSEFLLVGEGDLEQDLRRRAERLETAAFDGKVTFTGLIPREEVYRTLARSDLYISTSRVEGLPIAVMEAMACRCPVVLSDIPSHREVAGDADFIPLVPVGDAAGFARELDRFRRMSFVERRRIGDQCRALVESRFGLDRMLGEYERLYGELMTDG